MKYYFLNILVDVRFQRKWCYKPGNFFARFFCKIELKYDSFRC